jgi:hypothetical protein
MELTANELVYTPKDMDEIKLSYDSKKDGVWVSEGTDKFLFVPRNMVLNMLSELDKKIEENE